MVEIQFAKMDLNAVIPNKRKEDAGFDIFPCFKESYRMILPGETMKIPTGIASSFSSNYCIILKERGSTGSKGIGQRSGVIDSGYRNEWIVPITNHNNVPLIIVKESFKETEEYRELIKDGRFIEYDYDKAVSQALVIPVPEVILKEVSYNQLLANTSERMLDGFGSTDIKK